MGIAKDMLQSLPPELQESHETNVLQKAGVTVADIVYAQAALGDLRVYALLRSSEDVGHARALEGVRALRSIDEDASTAGETLAPKRTDSLVMSDLWRLLEFDSAPVALDALLRLYRYGVYQQYYRARKKHVWSRFALWWVTALMWKKVAALVVWILVQSLLSTLVGGIVGGLWGMMLVIVPGSSLLIYFLDIYNSR